MIWSSLSFSPSVRREGASALREAALESLGGGPAVATSLLVLEEPDPLGPLLPPHSAATPGAFDEDEAKHFEVLAGAGLPTPHR